MNHWSTVSFMPARQRLSLLSSAMFNLALALASFGRWPLRDKAAQRQLALLWGYVQPFARSTARALAVFCFCTTTYASGQLKDAANSDLLQLVKGRMGTLFIGMPRAQIEKRLQQSLELQFAGEGRAGVTLEKPAELQELQLRTYMGTPVVGVDVFFVERTGVLQIDFIFVGVPCDAVPSIQARLKAVSNGFAPTQNLSNPSASPKQTFRWGADNKPTCRVWLGKA